jgi:DNA-directed RNA polymerase subunit RPC12/RpoP
MVVTTTVRICLDCGRDNLASRGEEIDRCPDCDSMAIC